MGRAVEHFLFKIADAILLFLMDILITITKIRKFIDSIPIPTRIKDSFECVFWAYVIGILPFACLYCGYYSVPFQKFPVGVPWYHLLITWPLIGAFLIVIFFVVVLLLVFHYASNSLATGFVPAAKEVMESDPEEFKEEYPELYEELYEELKDSDV